jgi:hypothetical protein
VLGDLERGFERFVDSAIARGFRLQVQPAEIGRQLERAMLNGATTSVAGAMAPNAFAVMLHPDDAAIFDGWSDALCREMEGWLADLAFRRGLVTIAPMHVAIEADPRVRRRSVRARAQFQEGARKDANPAFVRVPELELIPIDDHAQSKLRAVSRASLGRTAGNDLVISDERVSRRHAIIEWEHGEWRINDLGSTNGTWVNGRQVSRARLADGDEIELGGRRFRVRLE